MASCTRWRFGLRRASWVTGALLLLALAPTSRAGTGTITVQSTNANAADSYLDEDHKTDKKGADQDFRLRGPKSTDTKNKHAIVQFQLPATLAGKTVLQSWLNLSQSSASRSVPIDARIHAVTQSWSEPDVGWTYRIGTTLPWTTPGGTRLSPWTARRLVSTATNNTVVGWQVGPIVNEWNLGLLANNGLLIVGDRHPTEEREVVFRSSEYTTTPSKTPQLVIEYTDEPPAIQRGYAEVQNDSVAVGWRNAPLNFWLDVRASDSTASGPSTGFDEITIEHGGTLRGKSLDSLIVAGVPISVGSVTLSDDGTAVRLRVPKITVNGRVRIAMRVDVLAPVGTSAELPVYVDDTTTPGAGRQILWPRDADGVAGNGDSWLLAFAVPTRVILTPASLTMLNGTCTTFAVTAALSTSNLYPVEGATFLVYDNPDQGYFARGTVDQNGRFCATQVGLTYLLVFVGGAFVPDGYAEITITAPLLPSIASVTLRTRAGVSTTTLVPQDTMLIDVSLSDGNGFKDITGLDFDLSFAGHASDVGAPAFRGLFRWRRGAPTPFTLVDPAPSSWSLIPALCSVDTTTNVTTAQTIRLAFRPGAIARASSIGQWTIKAIAMSATPLDTTSSSRTAINAQTRLTVAWDDSSGAFNAGPPGATLLPLRDPANGKVDAFILSNTTYNFEVVATNLAGLTTTSDTLRVGSPTQRMSWSFTTDHTAGGRLNTTYTTLATAQPASVSETPIAQPLYLWLDHPSPLTAQDYRGQIKTRIATSTGLRSAEQSIPLTATVSSSGAAATSALAEVLPHTVQVGVSAQTFTAYLLPTFGLFDTGIDRIRIGVPEAYGTPLVTSVRVNGSARSFSDASQPGVAEARLSSNVTLISVPIEVRFDVSTPTALDSLGSPFVVQFDDLGTSRPSQVAVEGNANATTDDGNNWVVRVGPGPVASVVVAPDSVALYPGDVQSFSAVATDAYGHPLAPAFAWSVLGSAGTVSSSGLFTATAVGLARVVVAGGGVADTARVTVRPIRGLHIVSHTVLSPLYQGQDSAFVRVRLANLGADSVRLDSLALTFTHVASGDANADFVTSVTSDSPAGLGGLDTVEVRVRMQVRPSAITGTVSIDARAVATEIASSVVVRDDTADAPVTAFVSPGGISFLAAQVPATILPRARNVPLLSLVLTNHYPEARTLHSLRIGNETTGPGDEDQLDVELGELSLYKDTDGNGILGAPDEFVLSTIALSDAVTFTPLGLAVPAGVTLKLLLVTSVPLDARDGDALDVSILDSTAVDFDRSVFYRTGWPLAPTGSFLIDGMAAEQIAVDPVPSANLLAGSSGNLALEVVIPPNGYQPDLLQRLAVVNAGTAEAGTDISRIRAWLDDGDKVFDVDRDPLLGDLVYTGDRWQRTGLANAIPLDGLRLFFTVGISDLARQGRTVQLMIPSGLDAGIGVQSGNSGPRDRAVINSSASAVSTVDRITVTSAVVDSMAIRPGARGVLVHHAIVTNSYADERSMTSMTFTNATRGPGSIAQRDGEIESATLRMDGDGDGKLSDFAADPVLGTSFFSGGRATFTGLIASIPAGTTAHFFLTVDVELSSARDGDVLSATIASPLDLGFKEATTITAAWPVDSRARAAVDGMIAAQVTNIGAPGVTLGPNDGPQVAMNLVVPWNGYEVDTLRSVFVANRGTATDTTGIQELHLWADGGDGVFSAGSGDDFDLGDMDLSGGLWRSASLRLPVGFAGRRLFVSLRTSASPRDSVTVRLAIPFNGLEMDPRSDGENDGPVDAPIENAQTILISTSPLLATLETGSEASTVGQPMLVRMIVRNVGSETVQGITPTGLSAIGTAGAVLDNGPAPTSFNLAPSETDTLVWTYHSTAAGDVRFTGAAQGIGALSGLVRRAVEATSNVHRVYLAAAELSLFPVQSMPFNVTQGQAGIVPFSLTLTNAGGAGASDIRLRSFRVRLEDEAGSGIVPSELLAGVAVNEGTNVYLTRTSLESTGAEINLILATPLLVTGQEPVTISLRLDLSDSTTTSAFRVVLPDSTVFLAEDATSGAPVTVRRESGAFPVVSGLARLVADATELRVYPLASSPARVARGTHDVTVGALRLENQGVGGITSDVQITTLGVTVTDTTGTPVTSAASYLSKITLRTALQTYAVRPIRTDDGADLALVLSPPLNVPASTPVDMTLTADVADTARIGAFRVRLQPPGSIEARDANSRDSVLVRYDSTPISGPPVVVEAAAQSVRVRGTALMPGSVLAGERDVTALLITLRHTAPAGTGRLSLDSLVVQVRDETRAPRVPDVYLDRLRILVEGSEVANLTSLPVTGGTIAAPLGGAVIEPGDTAHVTLIVDFSPSAPISFLELAAGGAGIVVSDANSGAIVRVDPEPGTDLPVVSGLTRIASPARDLFAGLQNRMPAALAVDGREVTVAYLTLRNAAPSGAGVIRVDHLRLRASDPAGRPLAVGAAGRFLAAYVGGALWARTDSLGADSTEATLLAASALEVDASEAVAVELRLTPQPSPSVAAFRLGIDAEGVGVIQPGSALLTVQVSPEAGSLFPQWTLAGSFTPASLAASWGNYPNPFAAGRQATSFVYYLASDADVTLRIWSPSGEGVATLLDRARRGAGLHQSDGWDGRNGRGDVVRNGVYVAELVVRYADGSTDRTRRKVAVVR